MNRLLDRLLNDTESVESCMMQGQVYIEGMKFLCKGKTGEELENFQGAYVSQYSKDLEGVSIPRDIYLILKANAIENGANVDSVLSCILRGFMELDKEECNRIAMLGKENLYISRRDK